MAIVSWKHPDGLREATRLTASVVATGTTLNVRNTDSLNADDYIIIGDVGNERSEIVKITTVDSDTQLTTAAVKFAHDKNDLVVYIPYNKLQNYSASTKAGTKTSQGSLVDIQVDDLVTEVNLSSVSSGYVFARYYNSTSLAESGYSPAVPVSGFTENSLRYILDMARKRTQETTEDLLSNDDLLKIAKECSDEIETVKKNWSFTQDSTDMVMTAGVQTYANPSDLAGYESIASVYLGYDNKELSYVDIKDFRYKMRSMPKTVITSDITSASTTINVKDTTAFGSSGTLAIGGDTSVAYTTTTNTTFAGVSGIVRNHTSGAEVFVTADLDQPTDYTIWSDDMMFWPPADQFYRVNVDYYKTIPRMTDVTIETVVPYPSLFVWYLIAEVHRMRGRASRANTYEKKFTTMLDLFRKKDKHKQILKMQPAKSYIKGAIDYEDAISTERQHRGA